MTMLADSTAAELADALDRTKHSPHVTGPLSILDEATLAYGWKYPEIEPLQRGFGNARLAHMSSYRTEVGNYSDEAWQTAMDAAHALAEALRPLGDTVIPRCQRPTGWGTCGLALEDDGTCHGRDHTDADTSHAVGE